MDIITGIIIFICGILFWQVFYVNLLKDSTGFIIRKVNTSYVVPSCDCSLYTLQGTFTSDLADEMLELKEVVKDNNLFVEDDYRVSFKGGKQYKIVHTFEVQDVRL